MVAIDSSSAISWFDYDFNHVSKTFQFHIDREFGQ